MALYGIADLHLSFSSDKPMDIYGGAWVNHTEKLKDAWLAEIKDEDTVLIAGDISWALRLEDAEVDLAWIHDLPGKKVMIKGNHDPWWSSISKLNALYEDIYFLQNTFFAYDEYAICGTRGWTCPGAYEFTEHDRKIYEREVLRLEMSYKDAVKKGYEKFIGMIHYPPTNEKNENSGFTDIFEYYGTEKVIYGHLHGETRRSSAEGIRRRVEYMLVACDVVDCKPVRIL